MLRFIFSVMTLLAVALPARGDDVLRPVSERYSRPDVQESPDFRRHVTPLLGRLGCNGRACHGSFQGQGGFRLSLFGYDFNFDHEGLMGGEDPRTNLKAPAESLILQKPTMGIPHEGGERMKVGSWEYNLLLRWVQSGAQNVGDEHPAFQGLEITPNELLFTRKGETVQLKVVAVWSDGVREDVTPLCRYQSNSTQVAEITEDGLVTSVDPGDTHVVVFYDAGVVPIPVIQPVSDRIGPKYPDTPTPTRIDELVVQKLRKLGIVQSDLAGDAEFLRRVSLDITGTLPHPDEVEAFLSDSSADKRARKIDELLERPGYASWWATRLCDITGNNEDHLVNVVPVRGQASQDWYDWIRARVERNVPYDELVEGIVLANSRNKGESYYDYCATMSAAYGPGGDKPVSFADREGMPHYWARANFRQSEDRVIGFAYTFLGIRIQCAQCHKHPFDQWTQDDFKQFTGFFTNTRLGQNPDSADDVREMMKELGLEDLRGNTLRREIPALLRQGKVVPFQEVFTTAPRRPASRGRFRNADRNRRIPAGASSAKLLGGEEFDLTQFDDPRQPLMDWLRSKNNPFFARAFVNRVWANYFNVGIVNPPDDLSLANPPSNKPLLDYLAQGFIDNNFDMKWLHREICNSRTYQLSWAPNDTNRLDEVNFSRAIPRRLPAEVAYDALALATASDEEFSRLQQEVGARAISLAHAGRRRNQQANSYALSIFGRSIRDTNCDCDRSADASLLQTVFLQNDGEMYNLIERRRTGWIDQAARELSGENRPSRDERTAAVEVTVEKQPGDSELVLSIKRRLAQLRKEGRTEQADRVEARLKEFLKRQQENRPQPEEPRREAGPDAGPVPTYAGANLDDLIRRTYLRSLSRPPAEDELGRARSYVESSENAVEGLKGLLWALINTKEFIVNH